MKDTLVVYPTDTLYGILGNAFSKEAVERIYLLKGRDENKPFIILIGSTEDLERFGIQLTHKQRSYLESVWPGKVSVVLPCTDKKFAYLHRGTNSLAFRLPKKKSLRLLLQKTGPLVAPSANPQGLPPAQTIREAKKYFGTQIDSYVSGGRRAGSASRVVSLLGDEPKILRP